MKKIITIFVALSIFLSSTLNAKAADTDNLILRMASTVGSENSLLYYNVFPDDTLSSGSTFRSNIISCVSDFDFSLLDSYDYYCITLSRTSSTQYPVQIFGFNSDLQPFYVGFANSSTREYGYFYGSLSQSGILYTVSTPGATPQSTSWTFYDPQFYNLPNGGYGVSPSSYYILDCNFPVYSAYEAVSSSGGSAKSELNKSWILNGGYSSLTDLFENASGYDLEGNIVSPEPEVLIESNSNHMYFQNCDLGFCEPTDIKNFTSFGGAYLYCKYTLDNWVVNHINDYQLQFNVVAAIGSEQNNFTYSMRVDRNGFVTIPFSYLFESQSSSAIPINRGFAAVVTNQKLGSDYNIAHLYSVANSNVPNFIRTLGAEYNYNLTDLGWSALKGGTLKYLCAWVSDGGTVSMNNLAEWSENVAQSFNPYILRVNVKLVSGNDVSGDYAEKFDLYAGDQSTVDTGGLVNNDPFVPDVDQDDGDLPSVPEDPNSTTPSTTVYTGGTFTGNFNGVIGFDPGYTDLKLDVNNDPDGNFTQYLDPMHNDDVGSWFMSFVNAMPSEMKAILVAGAGVGVFFGLYRFIRRG